MSEVIVRMPPSPTGSLHLGTARTALFNYLFAKNKGGEIIFRWEDTDLERSKPEFETEILDGLKWLGMDFEQESAKFVRQTENTEKHKRTLEKLWKTGHIFPCFTTPEEINEQRELAQKNKTNFVFWSEFREISKQEAEEKMKTEKFVWRLKVPKNKEITFSDAIKGDVKVNTNTLGDFVVARSDNSVLYLLANVVDDLDVNISHIIRGDDHVSNTPKQVLIFEALGEKIPKYAHIPLVLDSKKRKLSKRNVDANVCILIKDFKEKGFIPEGVINGLAFLGWNPKTTEEIFSLKELSRVFALEKVNKAAAQYDFGKMEWFNNQWLKKLEIIKIREYFLNWVNEYGNKKTSKEYEACSNLNQALEIARQKNATLKAMYEEIDYLLFPIEVDKANLQKEKMKIDAELAQKVLENIAEMLENISAENFNQAELKAKSIEKISELGLKNGQFLWPFRMALSGKEKSAGPFEIGEVLGKEESLRRIKACL